MVDRLTHYMDEPDKETVVEPPSEKPVKPLIPRRARAPLAIATGVAQIISTASGAPSGGELIDALATQQHLIDRSKGIVVSMNTITDTPTPEFGRNQEQGQIEPFIIETYQLRSSDVINSLAKLREKVKYDKNNKATELNNILAKASQKTLPDGDPGYAVLDAVLKDPEFGAANDKNKGDVTSAAVDLYPRLANKSQKTADKSEFNSRYVFAEKDGKLLASSFLEHKSGDYAFIYDPTQPDRGLFAFPIKEFAKQGFEFGLSVHTYIKKGADGKSNTFVRIVPSIIEKANGKIYFVSEPDMDGRLSRIPVVTSGDGSDSYATPEPLDLAKRADTGDTGGADWEKAGVSRDVYLNAMSEALNILHPDLRAGVESNDYKFNYERNGFENSQGEVWRKGMSPDNDPKKGWLRETDKTPFTFTAKDGKETTVTVVSEMNTRLGIGNRKHKNLQFTPDFEKGESKDEEGVIPFLEKYGDSSLEGKTIRIQWVSGNIPDYKTLNGSFVIGYLGSSGGYPLTAYAGYETDKDINIRAYNVGSVNAQIGDDEDMFTRSTAQAIMLAVKRLYGDPQELLKNVSEGRDMAKTFGLLRIPGKKPPKFVKLSNTPPTREGVKVSQGK